MSLTHAAAIPADGDSLPLGVAQLPGSGYGVDLAGAGYREDEYLVTGIATPWHYDDQGCAVTGESELPYTTRILVRRPADPDLFNGVLQAEPLHPEYDAASTWRALHPWIMRTGAAWVGVTQDPRIAESMRAEFDPKRYAALSIPHPSLRYEIVADVVAALRTGSVGFWDAAVGRAYLSGWSMTGSFCRVFLGEGFHERRRLPDASPVFDGYVIAISSGGAARGGYPGLGNDASRPGPADRRRVVGGHDVPVIELLSELESETHGPVLRPDSDDAHDRYRLYQVAGTSHDTTGPRRVTTNQEQYRRRGLPVPRRQIVEMRSDARMDFVARAVFALLDRWVRDGVAPPRADRFSFAEPAGLARGDAVPLTRDACGNVLGGIRTPWVEAAVARYDPHSTAVPDGCRPSPWMPTIDPAAIAWMVGNMRPLPPDVLRDRYPTATEYLARYAHGCQVLVGQGFLLWEDVEPLMVAAEYRARTYLGERGSAFAAQMQAAGQHRPPPWA